MLPFIGICCRLMKARTIGTNISCVCVCVRERKTDRERERERDILSGNKHETMSEGK